MSYHNGHEPTHDHLHDYKERRRQDREAAAATAAAGVGFYAAGQAYSSWSEQDKQTHGGVSRWERPLSDGAWGPFTMVGLLFAILTVWAVADYGDTGIVGVVSMGAVCAVSSAGAVLAWKAADPEQYYRNPWLKLFTVVLRIVTLLFGTIAAFFLISAAAEELVDDDD